MGLEAIATATPVAAEGGGGDLSGPGIVVLAAVLGLVAVELFRQWAVDVFRVPPAVRGEPRFLEGRRRR